MLIITVMISILYLVVLFMLHNFSNFIRLIYTMMSLYALVGWFYLLPKPGYKLCISICKYYCHHPTSSATMQSQSFEVIPL